MTISPVGSLKIYFTKPIFTEKFDKFFESRLLESQTTDIIEAQVITDNEVPELIKDITSVSFLHSD